MAADEREFTQMKNGKRIRLYSHSVAAILQVNDAPRLPPEDTTRAVMRKAGVAS